MNLEPSEEITKLQQDARKDIAAKLIANRQLKAYCTAWANDVMQKLYTPKKGDQELLFYHSRLPIEFTAEEWFIRYPVDEFNVRLDYLTLTAYAELKKA